VTEKATKAFDSAILPPGEQWKLVVPARAGAIHYHCTLHPLMEGSLTVEPPRP
jgi:plastocyanin